MRQLLSAVRDVFRLAMPYFRGDDRFAGWLILGGVIGLELTIVALNVLFNQWNARFYDAIQNKDWASFQRELLIFTLLAAAFIVGAVYQIYLQQWLRIRWRQWMTANYLQRWLEHGVHYRMRVVGDPADNPDQRIAEDLELFALRTIEIGIGLIGAVLTLDLLRGHPVEPVGRGGVPAVRQHDHDPRLSRVGRADLCGARHDRYALHRPAADRAQFQPATLRGGFSLSPGARARERRADRASGRRAGRAAPARRAVLDAGRQLPPHHERAEAAHRIFRDLYARLRSSSRSWW